MDNAANRYLTSDFREAPTLALASLMGLGPEDRKIIQKDKTFYGPLLNGIMLHRHLETPAHRGVNRRIFHEMPKGSLQSKLVRCIIQPRVQPYWYMWSLSDEELKQFFTVNTQIKKSSEQVLPVDPATVVGGFTVAGTATALYQISRSTVRAEARNRVRLFSGSPLVERVAKQFKLSPAAIRTAGNVAVPAMIIIGGLNVMASNGSDRARRELAARGLLAYEDL